MATEKKVFSIEGSWDRGLSKQRSIAPALDYFSKNSNVEINKSKATHQDELYRHLKELHLARNKKFGIVYLSFHGSRGCIQMSPLNSTCIKIEDLADNCEGIWLGN